MVSERSWGWVGLRRVYFRLAICSWTLLAWFNAESRGLWRVGYAALCLSSTERTCSGRDDSVKTTCADGSVQCVCFHVGSHLPTTLHRGFNSTESLISQDSTSESVKPPTRSPTPNYLTALKRSPSLITATIQHFQRQIISRTSPHLIPSSRPPTQEHREQKTPRRWQRARR